MFRFLCKLGGGNDYDYESDHFQIEREYTHHSRARPDITDYPFRRLPSRLEHYNPARPWTVPELRHRHTAPHRYRSPSMVHNIARVSPCRSHSVSFAVRVPPVVVDRRAPSSPPRRENVNFTTPRCVVALIPPQARTPNPHSNYRPLSPLSYS